MLFSTRLGRRLRLSIGAWMVLVTLLALLPLGAFSLLATYRLTADRQADGLDSLQRRAVSAGQAVTRELQRHLAILHTLAASDAAMTGDAAALHAQALRLLHVEHGVHAISMVDAQGRLAFSTLMPYGAPLPPTRHPEGHAPVFATGATVVSPLLTGASSGRRVIGLAVPVTSGGQVRFALRLTLLPDTLNVVLKQQPLPADWIASLIDQRAVIVARTTDADRFVGQEVTASLRENLNDAEHVFESVTKTGVEVATAVAAVSGTPWHVAVGRPLAALRAEVRESLLLTLAAGLACALLAAGGSFYLARELSREVRASAALPAAGLPRAAGSPVREVGAMAVALARARASASDASAALEGARLDALTGLPGRAALKEQAARLPTADPSQGGAGAAAIFIDLDGFKAVNDRMGHAEGDRVLVEVADVLRGCVREHDVLCRFGGDEFVVLLAVNPAYAEPVAFDVARRVVSGVAALGRGMGCSVGVAVAQAGEALDALVKRADHAMLQAKQAGKNRVELSLPA